MSDFDRNVAARGGFADRAAAVDAVKRLEDKGFKPFIARGSE